MRAITMTRSLADAQHEAAHAVVGIALGLRLDRITLDLPGEIGTEAALTIWHGTPWHHEAVAMMFAAGVAWERRCGDLSKASFDLADLRRLHVTGKRLTACERAAWAVLSERHALHTRIVRALVERDLTAADVRAVAHTPTIRK